MFDTRKEAPTELFPANTKFSINRELLWSYVCTNITQRSRENPFMGLKRERGIYPRESLESELFINIRPKNILNQLRDSSWSIHMILSQSILCETSRIHLRYSARTNIRV